MVERQRPCSTLEGHSTGIGSKERERGAGSNARRIGEIVQNNQSIAGRFDRAVGGRIWVLRRVEGQSLDVCVYHQLAAMRGIAVVFDEVTAGLRRDRIVDRIVGENRGIPSAGSAVERVVRRCADGG